MSSKMLPLRSAGYAYLIEYFDISVTENWHISFVSSTNFHRIKHIEESVEEIYPAKYWPGNGLGEHLEFAIKYDGINLLLLSILFENIQQQALVELICSKPTGKFTRKIWFLYEFITGKKLPIEDLKISNYVDVLDETAYYTLKNGEKSSRHRITNNLLGTASFCPIIRKTEKLVSFNALDLHKRCEEIVMAYPPELLRRALNYLYNKETKSSFEIEHVKPNAARIEKFIAALELAEKQDFFEKTKLIYLQNIIVDPRFKDHDYRKSQNYIGQTVGFQKEIIHFICPKPEDLPNLMQGLLACHGRIRSDSLPAVIHAAIIAYGFVFLHPFEDGNGRIHRFLIHNILALSGMVPKGVMFPVSAVMLKNTVDYDKSLEAFSRPLLQLIDYSMDSIGQMTVKNETVNYYKFIDMTKQAEALYEFVIKTVEEELVDELSFLANYDKTKKALQEIIDMPDRLVDLFIQLCLHNNGKLSSRKRESHFAFLSDSELNKMEEAIEMAYRINSEGKN